MIHVHADLAKNTRSVMENKLSNQVRVGVGAIVIKDNKVLCLDRINAHGAGTWSVPGGHLEFGETPHECAYREVLEETGVVIKNIRSAIWTNDFFPVEQKHYITLWMLAQWQSGNPAVMEPHKCTQVRWTVWEDFPQPWFPSHYNLHAQYLLQINNGIGNFISIKT